MIIKYKVSRFNRIFENKISILILLIFSFLYFSSVGILYSDEEFIENKSILNINDDDNESKEVKVEDEKITKIDKASGKDKSNRKQSSTIIQIREPFSFEEEINPNLHKLGRKINSLYKTNILMHLNRDVIHDDLLNHELDNINYFKQDIQDELKRQARNYLKERYLTKVVNLKKDIKLRMSIDSETEIVETLRGISGIRESKSIFNSIESILDRTQLINSDLKYSVGLRLRSSPLFKGDFEHAIEPVLKIKYKDIELKGKLKPGDGRFELELHGKVPIKYFNNKVAYSISSDDLRNAEWALDYTLRENSFIFIGGDIALAEFDREGDPVSSAVYAGFAFEF